DEDRPATYGYAATSEAVVAAFAKSWRAMIVVARTSSRVDAGLAGLRARNKNVGEFLLTRARSWAVADNDGSSGRMLVRGAAFPPKSCMSLVLYDCNDI